MVEFPSFETDRLFLDRIVCDDVEGVFELFTNPDVLRYYDLDALRDRRQAYDIITHFNARYEQSLGIRWAMRFKGDSELMGTCGFNSWDPAMRHAFLGYDLKPVYWGMGYAMEAVQAVLELGFSGELACGQLHRVQADIVPENHSSKQLLCKLGFRLEGVRRQAGFWDGQYHDLKCYGLLKHEFEVLQFESVSCG